MPMIFCSTVRPIHDTFKHSSRKNKANWQPGNFSATIIASVGRPNHHAVRPRGPTIAAQLICHIELISELSKNIHLNQWYTVLNI